MERPSRTMPLALAAVLLVWGTVDGAGQTTPAPRPIAAPERVDAANALIAEGYVLHDDMDAETALQRFRSAVAIAPTHYEGLWLAAAESVAVGILSGEEARSERLFEEAVGFARRAIAVSPDGVEGHEWLAVALGRHALSVGIRERVRFAEEILAVATRAVALDENSSIGHHVIGQWHAEVRRVSGFERFIARRFLGGRTFGSANHDDALFHLRRAVELTPTELVHRFELARVLMETERFGEARSEFEEIIAHPLVAPTDPVYKARSRDYLGRLRP